MQSSAEIKITPRYLMGPGPSDVHPSVLDALSTPLIGHLDPQFIDIMDSVKEMLKSLFRTGNQMTFPVSATGSAGMETCLVNLLEPGDAALICVNGVFGNRMSDIAQRCGAEVVRVEAPWGSPIDPNDVKKALKKSRFKLAGIVHAETSTGVLQPLEEISSAVHEAGTLLVADTVTSLGGVDVRVDDWRIDASYSGTQKCISAPPGLSPVTFSEDAVKAVVNRKSRVQSWYMDIGMIRNYWEGEKRVYHHTAPVSMVFSLYAALKLILSEGLDARFQRHRENHLLLREGLEKFGFEYIAPEEYRLPMLNAVRVPPGMDEQLIRSKLLEDFNIEVGGGLGEFAGKAWRVGIMGESCTDKHVKLLLSALEELL